MSGVFGACSDASLYAPGGIDLLSAGSGDDDASDGDSDDSDSSSEASIDDGLDSDPDGIDGDVDPGDSESGEAGDSSDTGGEAEPDAPVEAGPDGPVGPNICGDGWRDPVQEECDDGVEPMGPPVSRACTSSCVVVDRLAGDQSISEAKERWLGIGRHQIAGGVYGHAVVTMEVDSEDMARVALYAFSPVGVRLGGSSWGPVPIEADPVVAALPNGDYAVAYSEFGVDGDGLGIALVRVSNDGSTVQKKGVANGTMVFSQHSPDLFWTGKHLAVGWEDESTIPRRVCVRQFTEDLVPAGAQSCMFDYDDVSRIALDALVGEPIIAYRVDGPGTSVHRVHLPGGVIFNTPAIAAPAFDESIAILPLDDCTILTAYVDGNQVMTASVFNETGTELAPPFAFAGPRGRPTLAATDDSIYIAWWEPPELPLGGAGWDPFFEELWIQKLSWDGAGLTESAPPMPLPRHDAHRLGDQVIPALISLPYWPNGGILAAWTDLSGSNYGGQAVHGDVIIQLIPTPILRKGSE